MKRSFFRASLLSVALLSAPALAGIWVIEPDESQKNRFDPDRGNVTGEQLLSAWNDRVDEEASLQAQIYLLGLFDATEGMGWCKSKRTMPSTLREWTYGYFEKLPPERLKEKASVLMLEALKYYFPCRNKADK
ncbi:Rap1a/Tai family immunity protein [Cronobacter turicensis]